MKVTDIETLDLIGCCDCSFPTCPAPRVQTRAICGREIGVGGFAMDASGGYNTDTYTPAGDPDEAYVGRVYKKVTITNPLTATTTGPSLSQTASAVYTAIHTLARDSGGVCLTTISASYSGSGTSTAIYPSGPPPGRYFISSSYSWGGTTAGISGTETQSWSSAPTTVTTSKGYTDLAFDGPVTTEWTGATCVMTGANGSVTFVYENEVLGEYRIGVPSSFSTTEVPRSFFRAEWDEYFFPAEWDDWDALRDAREAAQKVHDEWEAGGSVGTEPEVPDDPGPEPEDRPIFVVSRSWTWPGSMTNPWSDYYEMTRPEAAETIVGEVRRVNMAIWCWRSARIGSLPTWHGEIYQPEEDEE